MQILALVMYLYLLLIYYTLTAPFLPSTASHVALQVIYGVAAAAALTFGVIATYVLQSLVSVTKLHAPLESLVSSAVHDVQLAGPFRSQPERRCCCHHTNRLQMQHLPGNVMPVMFKHRLATPLHQGIVVLLAGIVCAALPPPVAHCTGSMV